MVAAASRYNPGIRFTVYPDKDHNSWDTTYNSSDTLYRWFLAQKKHVYREVPVAPQDGAKVHWHLRGCGRRYGADNRDKKRIDGAAGKGFGAVAARR
jgi:hypothetical protein